MMPGFRQLVYFSSVGSDGRETAGNVKCVHAEGEIEIKSWVLFVCISFSFFSQDGKVKSSCSSLVCSLRGGNTTPPVLVSWLSTFTPCDWISRSLMNYSWLALVILAGRKKTWPLLACHTVSPGCFHPPSHLLSLSCWQHRLWQFKVLLFFFFSHFFFPGGLKTSFSEHTLKTPQRWTVEIMITFFLSVCLVFFNRNAVLEFGTLRQCNCWDLNLQKPHKPYCVTVSFFLVHSRHHALFLYIVFSILVIEEKENAFSL